MNAKHVDGIEKKKLLLYALSTCIWCRKTKNLLNELGVSYDYVDVDLLEGSDQDFAVEQVKKFNPSGGFPTLVVDDKEAVRGFDEIKIRELLEK
ncbi:MAG TPA: glutaredoxin family protein [Actinobacteria bacterium]|nr:glutaredoxin family protein [Actinomycetota bacterium]